jgi:hypothetical protein
MYYCFSVNAKVGVMAVVVVVVIVEIAALMNKFVFNERAAGNPL